MKLIEIFQQDAWDAFQAAQPSAQFWQSWSWGEFRVSRGSLVRRFALAGDDGHWAAAIQMEFRARRFGFGYWFAPRGPVFSSALAPDVRRTVMMTLCEELLKQKALRQKTLFWRIEPLSELSKPEGLVPLSFCRVHPENPSSTIVLDLALPVEELLKRMHEKTRYNIRVAERHGVRTRLAKDEKDITAFLDLMDETAARDGFVQHPRAYLQATLAFLQPLGLAQVRLAELNGKVLSANLEILFGDTVTYLYGSSSSEQRNAMAPFALHWDAIRDAHGRGFQLYDFWGANPQSRAMFAYKASWEGITRFKSGWGGRLVNFVGTWDLPLVPVPVYRLMFLRQFFRG